MVSISGDRRFRGDDAFKATAGWTRYAPIPLWKNNCLLLVLVDDLVVCLDHVVVRRLLRFRSGCGLARLR